MDVVKAAFEAGIKLGAAFHQFIGSPVSEKNSEVLEKAIESCIRLQPFVLDAKVKINVKKTSAFGYTSLSPEMLEIFVTVKVGNAIVKAALKWDEEKQYPLMELVF
ncbi:MAG: dihydroneopterin aldolase family protein [Archaeoglobaceae archaeon]|nr:dihydroneopterin aldolase family protein [Archaeoglobaceae archaeon]MCX8152264.1 dihydroneopterin aldolase family protein [Archaeoglobaceae archaeon]MDW8013942.1 dihydroneopterin aldolase family protein [Archaeoglobaceae archaeon]